MISEVLNQPTVATQWVFSFPAWGWFYYEMAYLREQTTFFAIKSHIRVNPYIDKFIENGDSYLFL